MIKNNQQPTTCPICKENLTSTLGDHVRTSHDESVLKELIYTDKLNGIPDIKIGARYGISFNYLEKVITEKTGTNISLIKPKKIKTWSPKDYNGEATTVWSFKSRGNWATHDGRYRGNWSPFIPRNVIQRYTKPGDTVLDQFIGGGTTSVEAKLLGRRCIARDINPASIELSKTNSSFDMPVELGTNVEFFEPEFVVGDARNLEGINNNSIDLICTHPPYAGIVNYSQEVEGDLSKLSVDDFLSEMRTVADESYRVLKPGCKCAVLIGDGRKNKKVVPIGFQTIRQFLDAGFILKELVIKRQHNCKTTGFWYNNSIKFNFLLLAHEYLPIFEKPKMKPAMIKEVKSRTILPYSDTRINQTLDENGNFETTTVWLDGDIDQIVKKNLIKRYVPEKQPLLEIQIAEGLGPTVDNIEGTVFIRTPNISKESAGKYLTTLNSLVDHFIEKSLNNETLIIEIKDIRIRNHIFPLSLLVFEELNKNVRVQLNEIIIVAPSESEKKSKEPLDVVHRYLFVGTVKN
ncbi:DNA methyltransferase [Chloroflexota bacterium]